MPLGPLATSNPAERRYALEVNVPGAYECLRAVLPEMLARDWGRVVTASSVAAAAELAGTGVKVNAVYPGMTETAMLAQIRDAPVEAIGAEQRNRVRERFEQGGLNRPSDMGRFIAAVVLSDLHGEIVNVEDDRGRELLATRPA